MHHAGGEQISWLYRPSLHSVFAFLEELGGGTDVARPLGLAFFVAMAFAGLPVGGGKPARTGNVSKLFLALAVLPLVFAVVTSFKQSTINPRYYLFAVPYALMWLVGRLESGAATSKVRSTAFVFAVGVILTGTILFHTRSRNEGWKDAYAPVRQNVAPGDVIAFSGFEAPFVYYARRDGTLELARLGPCQEWSLSLDRCQNDVLQDVEALVGKRKRLWLISQGWGFELKQRCDAILEPLLQTQFQEWPISSAYTDPVYQIVFVNLYET